MGIFEILVVTAIVAVVFGLVIAAMAVGVIFSNRQIKGSCGGLSTMQGGDGSPCMVCGGQSEECDEAQLAECTEAAEQNTAESCITPTSCASGLSCREKGICDGRREFARTAPRADDEDED